MNKIIAFAFLMITSLTNAQDVLHMKNDSKLMVKVREINTKEVKYKKYDNLEGPDYSVDKKDVEKIVYENGSIEQVAKKADSLEFKSNIISFNYGDLMKVRANFSYERLFRAGFMGIKIPIAVSFENDNYSYYDDSPLFFSGVDFNFYPYGQKKLTYFTGLAVRMGMTQSYNEIIYDDYTYPYYGSNYRYRPSAFFMGGYVNNGLTLHLTKNFSISSMFGLGIKGKEASGRLYSHAIGELNASIRF